MKQILPGRLTAVCMLVAICPVINPGISLASVDAPLVIDAPWIAEAPPVSKVLAAYMTITNTESEKLNINRVTSACFKKIEIHRTVLENGMASMEHQTELSIPASGKISLEPGGYHMMLFEPVVTLKAGDKCVLNISTTNEQTQSVTVSVKKAGNHAQHHHH